MNKALILVVEDDRPIRNLIVTTLKTHDYKYITAENGSSAILEASSHKPEIILLDLGLPDMEGVDVIKKVRTWSNVPIIVISARSEDVDKIEALDAGADDYITKPFSVNELLARISAHLRREQRSHNKTKSKFSEDLIIDYSDRSLYIKGHKIELSNKEFEIIQLLSSNAGQVFDREKIYENIWGIDGNGDSVVIKEHIRKIRLKFNEFTDKGYITTVWGVGYKWEK